MYKKKSDYYVYDTQFYFFFFLQKSLYIAFPVYEFANKIENIYHTGNLTYVKPPSIFQRYQVFFLRCWIVCIDKQVLLQLCLTEVRWANISTSSNIKQKSGARKKMGPAIIVRV